MVRINQALYVPPQVPAVAEWGLALLGLLLAGFAARQLGRRS
ncbi:MAG: IPTL-CTERM sorting domain-containing protein [Burkholderiales bacterium]|nr:IPTL-CTERM sorting domain-containing protein [Burkholderiales bacterium]